MDPQTILVTIVSATVSLAVPNFLEKLCNSTGICYLFETPRLVRSMIKQLEKRENVLGLSVA